MRRETTASRSGRGLWRSAAARAALAIVLPLAGCSAWWSSVHFGGCEEATVEGILEMTKEGVPEDVIVSKIQQCPGDYDLGAARIIELHGQGVSEKVLDAMLKAEKGKDERPYGPYPYGYPYLSYPYPSWYRGWFYPWGPWWDP